MKEKIETILNNFDAPANVVGVREGPVVNTYLLELGPTTRVRSLSGLDEDLALRLNVDRVRVVPNVPGVPYAGVEIPRADRQVVNFTPDFSNTLELPFPLGVDTMGKPMWADLVDGPHLLVAGTTGSGKSIALHAMLGNFCAVWGPASLRLVLIDPKMLEFQAYRRLPYIQGEIVTNAHVAANVLSTLVEEMQQRYKTLASTGHRSIQEFNARGGRMPYTVVIIDEWADLYMAAKKAVEKPLVQLAQKARACGIHIILATQRPSADVISGIIKANFPSRMALRVSTMTDSRVVLDENGAEALEGKGDALVKGLGLSGTRRVHMPFVDPQFIVNKLNQQGTA